MGYFFLFVSFRFLTINELFRAKGLFDCTLLYGYDDDDDDMECFVKRAYGIIFTFLVSKTRVMYEYISIKYIKIYCEK